MKGLGKKEKVERIDVPKGFMKSDEITMHDTGIEALEVNIQDEA